MNGRDERAANHPDHRCEHGHRRGDGQAPARRRPPPRPLRPARGAAAGARRRARRRRRRLRQDLRRRPSGSRSRSSWPQRDDRFGEIDVVFANAGFGASRGFLEESPEQWRSMVLTNVLGVAHTIRATLPHLLERGTGHYLITSSVAGRRALPGSLYSATKWAATAIGESLRAGAPPDAREHRDQGDPDRARAWSTPPFFDNRPSDALEADDIASAVLYAPQPARSGRRQRDPDPADVRSRPDHPTSARRMAALTRV